jgi:hypothetical protein
MGWLTNKELIVRDDFSRFGRYLVFKRFLNKVKIGTEKECWEWRGAKLGDYGGFDWPEKRIVTAHIASYYLFIGTIPETSSGKRKLQVCHSCDNPICVNPYHLWLGTQKQNVADRDKKGRGKLPDNSGAANGMSKLKEYDVKKMLRLCHKENWTQEAIARKFAITQSSVHSIVHGKSWKHIQ